MVLPSFVIIMAIFYVLQAFQNAKAVQYAFQGIRAGVLVLMLKALYKMLKTNRKDAVSLLLMGGSFVLTAFVGVNTFLVIGLCGAAGLVSAVIAERRLGK